MSIRSERIKALIDASGYSYQDLEKITEIKKSSLQRYESGVTSKIPLDVIEKLSSAFNVSKEYLMGWDIKEISSGEVQLTEGEKQMLELFKLVPEDRQHLVLEMIRAALKTK